VQASYKTFKKSLTKNASQLRRKESFTKEILTLYTIEKEVRCEGMITKAVIPAAGLGTRFLEGLV